MAEHVVPLGPITASKWLSFMKDRHRRLREWSLGAKAENCGSSGWRIRETGSNTNWRKRSTFQRGVWVHSVATVDDPAVCVLNLGSDTHTIKAPRGYHWEIDANGLCLKGKAGEYHPDTDDLLSGGDYIVGQLKEAAATRRANRLKEKQRMSMIRRAEKEGATVCLRDSLKAGNCEVGTRNWALRHGLDAGKHYRPTQLLKLANGDASRVSLVVAFALRRHTTEMARGYADLADHR